MVTLKRSIKTVARVMLAPKLDVITLAKSTKRMPGKGSSSGAAEAHGRSPRSSQKESSMIGACKEKLLKSVQVKMRDEIQTGMATQSYLN